MSDTDSRELALPLDSDIISFTPNFSIFVLPPSTVCLYSEDRKFLLRGAVYCALATLIGAGNRRQEIFRGLERNFSAAEIDEAFEHLFTRNFVVSASPGNDPTAACWASLGMMPEAAAENLRNVGVQIQSLGVSGADALRAALSGLGVRLVDRSADLLIVLASDYLDPRLAELNAQRLISAQAWVLVQPSGIFPLVGPLFSPGKGACWTCLAHRMQRNRQIKAFLNRRGATCVAASPLDANVLGPSAIGIAALEIAKVIASNFRTDLHERLISLDLLGSTITRHHVPARPQCPSCGSKVLSSPERAPIPIRLHAGGRLVATGSGPRAVAPAATVARFRKHVSPLTGVVSHLDRITSELPLNVSYLAKYSFSPLPETVEALRAGLSRDSYGKGSTTEESEASALMEAIERYSGVFQGDEIRTKRRFVDFPAGDAILPNDILLLSDAQHGDTTAAESSGRGAKVPRPFDRTAGIEWSPVWSLRDDRFKYLPTGLLYYFHNGGGGQMHADSNGCAAGNTLEEAIVQGFLELVKRDAYAIWWYNRLRRAEIDLDKLSDPYVRELRSQLAAAGRKLWALDLTSDVGVPAVVAVSCWTEGGQERVEIGAGAHFNYQFAAVRAITELNRRLAIDGMSGRGTGRVDAGPVPLRKHAYLLPARKGAPRPRLAQSAKFAALDRREQVLACVKLAKRAGLDFLVLDQTRPDIEVPVVRVIVPGLRHCYRRFAPGRLYDVPVKLGLRKRPLSEAELNPLHPPT
jgi:oxazoline/thiazoline synthase